MKLSNLRKPFISGTVLLILLFAASFFGQSVKAERNKIAVNTPVGQTLYTQFALYHEAYRHRTTNYRKGILVPVNTKVSFVKSDRSEIVVKLPDGYELVLDNVKKYSGEKIDVIFNRTFDTRPVKLSHFNRTELKGIKHGRALPSMSKTAVIVALGYPPRHKTPSLKWNTWRYWETRFNSFTVHFKNNRVTYISE